MKFEYLRSLCVTSFVAIGGICFLFFLRNNFENDEIFLDLVSLRLLGGPLFVAASLGWAFPASRYSQRSGVLATSVVAAARKKITINILLLNALLFLVLALFDFRHEIELLVLLCPLNAQASFVLTRTLGGEFHASNFQLIANGIMPVAALVFTPPLLAYLWCSYVVCFGPIFVMVLYFTRDSLRRVKIKRPPTAFARFRLLKTAHGLSRRLTPYIFITSMPLITSSGAEVIALGAYILRSIDVFVGAFFRISQVFIHKIRSSGSRGRPGSGHLGWSPIILVTSLFSGALMVSPPIAVTGLAVLCCVSSICLQVWYERSDLPLYTFMSTAVFYIPISLLVLKNVNLP